MKDFENAYSEIKIKMSIDTSVLVCRFFEISTNDARLTMPHLCIFLALTNVWVFNLYRNPITITRSEIMRLAKINAKTTYHKCIRDLQDAGYIEYYPSFHPHGASKIVLCLADSSINYLTE
jgi:hypothetical protein